MTPARSAVDVRRATWILLSKIGSSNEHPCKRAPVRLRLRYQLSGQRRSNRALPGNRGQGPAVIHQLGTRPVARHDRRGSNRCSCNSALNGLFPRDTPYKGRARPTLPVPSCSTFVAGRAVSVGHAATVASLHRPIAQANSGETMVGPTPRWLANPLRRAAAAAWALPSPGSSTAVTPSIPFHSARP